MGISQGVAGAAVVPQEMVAKLVNFLRLSWPELHDIWGNPNVSRWDPGSLQGGGSRCSGSEEAGPDVNQLWLQVSEAGLAETRVNDDKPNLDSGDLSWHREE